MSPPPIKPVIFIGSSRKDLKSFPADVQDEIGRSLLAVQLGRIPASSKPLKGFGGASVQEIVADSPGSTYRAVYTVRFGEIVYVLHSFQKKSTRGVATPKHVMDVVAARLRIAEEHYRSRGGSA